MFGLGPMEVFAVAFILVLLFGGKRFASLGKDLGTGLRNFKTGLSEVVKGDDEEGGDK